MRVVYSGGTICNFKTLQRLVLLADEIAFMDRPSVTFSSFGTVGHDSEFRRFQLADTPVKFSVHAPPSGPANQLYKNYIEADLRNPQFIRTVIDGLKNDEIFCGRLIQRTANYGWGTGQQVVDALLQDHTLYEGEYNLTRDPKLLYVPDTPEGRRQTLSTLLLEASIHATNALFTAEEAGLIPVSDDPYFCQLLAIRTSQSKYVLQAAPLASLLGLAVAKSVLPDESLSHLKMEDLFEFRRSAKDSYAAWTAELDRLSIKLLDVPPERLTVEATKIIVTEVRPKMLQLRRDMIGARDKFFGDLFKAVSRWEVPTLSLSYLAGLSVPAAIAAFTSALVPAVPSVVDYFVQRRALVRNNSMAYLVGLTKALDDERG